MNTQNRRTFIGLFAALFAPIRKAFRGAEPKPRSPNPTQWGIELNQRSYGVEPAQSVFQIGRPAVFADPSGKKLFSMVGIENGVYYQFTDGTSEFYEYPKRTNPMASSSAEALD